VRKTNLRVRVSLYMNIIKYKPRPHLRDFDYIGRYRYFVTICTDRRKAVLVKSNHLIEKMIAVLDQAGEKHFFIVWINCFMPDHLHLLVEGKHEHSDLKKFIKDFKQRTGYWYKHGEFDAGNKLWQPGYYEHVLRKEEDTTEVLLYILNNPVRGGLVANYLDYRYSGSRVIDIKEILI
jgi:putative transposase